MDDPTYRRWRRQLDDQLQPASLDDGPQTAIADPYERQLLLLVTEARRVMATIEPTLPTVTIIDNNKYAFVLSILDRVLEFDDFVLCEYTYELPSGARPGVRLQLEMGAAGRQVSVLLFEDVRRWQLDPTGHKISYQLLALLLGRAAIAAHVAAESAEYFDHDWTWQEHLREALCLPIRLLDED